MSDPVLDWKRTGDVITLTLNRPGKRNALNGALVAALGEALARSGNDPTAKVLVLSGAGKDFCAGADLEELQRIRDMSAEQNLADARALGEVFTALRLLPIPTVAVVQGRALAGGCGLATACDLVLAREDAEFGYPEVHLGFVPAMVMTILRRKVPESAALDLVLRGRRIGAGDAQHIGLVTRVLEREGFEDEVSRYVAELAAPPRSAVVRTKALFHELGELGFHEGMARAAEVNVAARMTEECREGLRRFLSRER